MDRYIKTTEKEKEGMTEWMSDEDRTQSVKRKEIARQAEPNTALDKWTKTSEWN